MATAVAVEPKIPKRIGETEELKTSYAIPFWLRDLQIASSIKAVEKRIEPVAEGTKLEETIAVVGFGPSLQDTWEQVRDYKTIFTCSGAHKFLLDKGLTPEGRTWYHVEVDPREHKIQLLGEPRPGIIYLPSSTCHPAYFDHLKKFDADIRLWHVFDNSEDAIRVLPRGEWAITGGSNVGLRCMTIARFFGHYKMDVFGVDGCEKVGGEEKKKHAAAHPLQDGVPFALYEYEGVDYRTTQSLLHCARETFHELDMMPDVEAKFHGTGLVQEMAKKYKPTKRDPNQKAMIAFNRPEVISPEYVELNRKLHAENLFYGVGGKKHAEIVVKLKEQTKAESVLDYGSGKGFLAEALPFPIWEYDPAISGKDEVPRPADLVVCTDVLEHVEPDKILFVLDDLHRVTKKIGYIVIHTGSSSKILADGRNAHILQRDVEWWTKMLGKFFTIGQSWAKIPLITFVVEPRPRKKKLIGKVA